MLEAYVERGDGTIEAIHRFDVDRARLEAVLDLGAEPAADGSAHWWESFAAAQEVGLAARVRVTRPEEFEALYVVGLDDQAPGPLFLAHRDSGRLGVLPAGTPTNTVHGAVAGGDDTAARGWLELVRRSTHPAERELSRLLTGDDGALGPLLGAPDEDWDPRRWTRMIVDALWPALWGHGLADLWKLRDRDVHALAELAGAALVPEGPYPAIRVGAQPYGILALTPARSWTPAPGEPAVLGRLTEVLAGALPAWAAAGERAGTVAGADAEQLLDVVGRVPVATHIRARPLLPLEAVALAALVPGSDAAAALDAWDTRIRAVRERLRAMTRLALGTLERPLVIWGASSPVTIKIAADDDARLAALLVSLVEGGAQRALLAFPDELAAELDRRAVDEVGLLGRLLVRAAQHAVATIGRSLLEADSPPLPESAQVAVLEDVLYADRRTRPSGALSATDSRLTRMQRSIVRALHGSRGPRNWENETVRRLVTALRGIGSVPPADRDRLARGALDCASHRLDAWAAVPAVARLEALLTAEAPVARRLGAYGWLDTPRPASDAGTAPPVEYMLAPSDAHALTAAVLRDRQLADPERFDIRLTAPRVRAARRLADAVRAGIHPSEHLGAEVERLVGDAPTIERLRRAYPIRREDGARRACDGRAVLQALRDDPPGVPVNRTARRALEELAAATDAYADLLLAEAAYRVVAGRGERAGAPLDAAAGLGPPPELEILRPVARGRVVRTACATLVAAPRARRLPTRPAALAAVPPLDVAEPALAGALAASLGDPQAWRWAFAEGSPRVTLEDLGLRPVDALAFPAHELEQLARERAGDPEGAVTDAAGTALRRLVGERLRMLGSRPATAADLNPLGAGAESSGERFPSEDLHERLEALTRVASALATELEAVKAAPTAARARRVLADARRWGIPIGFVTDPADAANQAGRAAVTLRERLAAGPADPAAATGEELNDAIVRLVAPNGDLALFGRIAVAALPPLARPADEAAFALDWLSAVAAVRPAFAHIEAARLDGVALSPWATRPDDPWQRTLSEHDQVVVFTDLELATLPRRGSVAARFVDRWSETVPAATVTASAALRYQAPQARAPQAILVAVPPDIDAPSDRDAMLAVVREARMLARVRAALPETLTDVPELLPLAAVPASGPTGVALEAAP